MYSMLECAGVDLGKVSIDGHEQVWTLIADGNSWEYNGLTARQIAISSSFLSSNGLVQNCMTVMMVYARKSGIYTEQCMPPLLFTSSKSHQALEATH